MDEKQALEFLGTNCEPCPKCKYYNNFYCHRNWGTRGMAPCDITGIAIDVLKSFIEEKTKSWIPCSERKPKVRIDVLLQFEKNLAVGFYSHGMWNLNTGNGFYTEIMEDEDQPIAWMNLPEVDDDKD